MMTHMDLLEEYDLHVLQVLSTTVWSCNLEFKNFFFQKKKLESKVHEIYKFSFSSEGTPIKGARQAEDVYESIKLITENLTKTENKRKKK